MSTSRKMAYVEATMAPTSYLYNLAKDFAQHGQPAQWSEGHPVTWSTSGEAPIIVGDTIRTSAVTQDQKFLAVGTSDSIKIYMIENLQLCQTLSLSPNITPNDLEWKPHQSGESTYSVLSNLFGWESTQQAIWKIDQNGHAHEDNNLPSFSTNGHRFPRSERLFSASGEKFLISQQEWNGRTVAQHSIEIWSLADSSRQLRIEDAHQESITCAEFILNDSAIASCSLDQTVKLWNAETGELLHKFESGYQNGIVALSPDSSRIACGSRGKVFIWNMNTKDMERDLNLGTESWARSLAWSPDGMYLAFGGTGGVLRLYDVVSGEITQEWEVEPKYASTIEVQGLSWFDNNKKISFSTGRDWGIEAYDLEQNVKWRFEPESQERGKIRLHRLPRLQSFWLVAEQKLICIHADGKIRKWGL